MDIRVGQVRKTIDDERLYAVTYEDACGWSGVFLDNGEVLRNVGWTYIGDDELVIEYHTWQEAINYKKEVKND